MKNILFYKYVKLNNLRQFKVNHLNLCKSLNLKGKVLIAKEGINGCLSGNEKDIKKYINKMHKDKRFSDVHFKESNTKNYDFKRMIVKVRKEIITTPFGKVKFNTDYIEPIQLKNMLDNHEDFILLDARNNFETKLGKFKKAITLNIDHFQEFPYAVKNLNKNKRIVTYCTGGIRCEKASSFLKQQGYDVLQLHGGIINYGLTAGNAHWQGDCFVFDRRGAIKVTGELINNTQCNLCFIPTKGLNKCVNCDKEFIACSDCIKILNNCCSKFCRNKK